MLDSITSSSIGLMKIGSSVGIVSGYNILIKVYNRFIKEIDEFKPTGNLGNIDSFKDSMDKLRLPLIKKSYEFQEEAKSKILSNNFFLRITINFLSLQNEPS